MAMSPFQDTISGFPLFGGAACPFIWSSVGQQGDYYELASEQRWLFRSRWIHRLFSSTLGERAAFSAVRLKSLNTEEEERVSEWVRVREWERDPFEGSWGTNKLCLAQMGEKGRADCHLSGTLKCQSITPELLIVCSSKLLCENSANRLFGERAISQWKSKAHFINAKNVTCHVEHTVGSEHVKSDFVMSPMVKLLFECKYFMREA